MHGGASGDKTKSYEIMVCFFYCSEEARIQAEKEDEERRLREEAEAKERMRMEKEVGLHLFINIFAPFFISYIFSRSFFVKFKAWILTIVNHILRHHEVFHATHECSSSSLSQRFV